MARPLRIEFPGAFYHVTSRGNEKKDIFRSRKDREQFFFYLESATERYGAFVHAYCLMTNHYHLLLETPHGNLSEIMRYVNGSYTTYFNTKRKRSGHLFQGRFRSIVVDADEYAMELSRYIHLNPVRAGKVSHPDDYEWSSYRSYVGNSVSPGWLKTEFILSSFGKKGREKNYRTFVEDLLAAEYGSPLLDVVASTLLGSPEFVTGIFGKYVNVQKPDRSVPAVRALTRSLSIEEVARKAGEMLPGREVLARKLAMYVCHRYCGEKLKQIGERFGIGDSAVSLASKRLDTELVRDEDLKKALEMLRRELNL